LIKKIPFPKKSWHKVLSNYTAYPKL
jgi:hypothetical protein